MLGCTAEHGVQGADRQCVGSAFTDGLQQGFQRLGIAKPAIPVAMQRVQLNAHPPCSRGGLMQGIGNTEAVCRGHGQGELLIVQLYPVVADGNHARQYGVSIQLDRQRITVFQVHDALAMGVEIT